MSLKPTIILLENYMGNKVPADSLAFYHDPKDFKSTYKMKALSDDDVRIIENYAASGIADKSHELVLDHVSFYVLCRY